MSISFPSQTRRGALATLAAGGAVSAASAQTPPSISLERAPDAPADWDFLVGRWRVKHRKLKGRLVGSTEWETFEGTCVNWPTLGGFGNIEDNILEAPGGTYRAVGVRAFDRKTGEWAIWWLDERFVGTMDPPVRGGFKGGVGTFLANDTLEGRPIVVRFRWSRITARSARWEQAFSPDGGKTWEVNWEMEFTRA